MERTENLIMQEDRWKPLKEMNLTDDFLFDVATAELENCKTIIELSTGLRLKSLKWKEGQKVIHNIPGKCGIRMDFVAESEDGRVFDVEMQNRKEGNIPKRTRFYQALMDAPMLKSGEKGFDKLKPLFIIVICDYDPYGMKKYCYNVCSCHTTESSLPSRTVRGKIFSITWREHVRTHTTYKLISVYRHHVVDVKAHNCNIVYTLHDIAK